MPLMLAWYFQSREGMLRARDFFIAAGLLLVPVGLIAKQPDLGTAIPGGGGGLYVLFFAGLTWRLILPVAVVGIVGIGAIVAMGDTICQPASNGRACGIPEAPGVHPARSHLRPLGRASTSSSPPSPSAPAACFGKGWGRGTRPTWTSCPNGIPISSSRCSPRNSGLPAPCFWC